MGSNGKIYGNYVYNVLALAKIGIGIVIKDTLHSFYMLI